jgi:hypothetical protein
MSADGGAALLRQQLGTERNLRLSIEAQLRELKRDFVAARLVESSHHEYIIFRIPRAKWFYCRQTRLAVVGFFSRQCYKISRLFEDIKELAWPKPPSEHEE